MCAAYYKNLFVFAVTVEEIDEDMDYIEEGSQLVCTCLMYLTT